MCLGKQAEGGGSPHGSELAPITLRARR
jgi:hypothetical protein